MEKLNVQGDIDSRQKIETMVTPVIETENKEIYDESQESVPNSENNAERGQDKKPNRKTKGDI